MLHRGYELKRFYVTSYDMKGVECYKRNNHTIRLESPTPTLKLVYKYKGIKMGGRERE